MPITKYPQKSQPLWKEWDRKAQKNGPRHEVHAVNGDRYMGEWKDDMRHGEWGDLEGRRVWRLSQDGCRGQESSMQQPLRVHKVGLRDSSKGEH